MDSRAKTNLISKELAFKQSLGRLFRKINQLPNFSDEDWQFIFKAKYLLNDEYKEDVESKISEAIVITLEGDNLESKRDLLAEEAKSKDRPQLEFEEIKAEFADIIGENREYILGLTEFLDEVDRNLTLLQEFFKEFYTSKSYILNTEDQIKLLQEAIKDFENLPALLNQIQRILAVLMNTKLDPSSPQISCRITTFNNLQSLEQAIHHVLAKKSSKLVETIERDEEEIQTRLVLLQNQLIANKENLSRDQFIISISDSIEKLQSELKAAQLNERQLIDEELLYLNLVYMDEIKEQKRFELELKKDNSGNKNHIYEHLSLELKELEDREEPGILFKLKRKALEDLRNDYLYPIILQSAKSTSASEEKESKKLSSEPFYALMTNHAKNTEKVLFPYYMAINAALAENNMDLLIKSLKAFGHRLLKVAKKHKTTPEKILQEVTAFRNIQFPPLHLLLALQNKLVHIQNPDKDLVEGLNLYKMLSGSARFKKQIRSTLKEQKEGNVQPNKLEAQENKDIQTKEFTQLSPVEKLSFQILGLHGFTYQNPWEIPTAQLFKDLITKLSLHQIKISLKDLVKNHGTNKEVAKQFQKQLFNYGLTHFSQIGSRRLASNSLYEAPAEFEARKNLVGIVDMIMDFPWNISLPDAKVASKIVTTIKNMSKNNKEWSDILFEIQMIAENAIHDFSQPHDATAVTFYQALLSIKLGDENELKSILLSIKQNHKEALTEKAESDAHHIEQQLDRLKQDVIEIEKMPPRYSQKKAREELLKELTQRKKLLVSKLAKLHPPVVIELPAATVETKVEINPIPSKFDNLTVLHKEIQIMQNDFLSLYNQLIIDRVGKTEKPAEIKKMEHAATELVNILKRLANRYVAEDPKDPDKLNEIYIAFHKSCGDVSIAYLNLKIESLMPAAEDKSEAKQIQYGAKHSNFKLLLDKREHLRTLQTTLEGKDSSKERKHPLKTSTEKLQAFYKKHAEVQKKLTDHRGRVSSFLSLLSAIVNRWKAKTSAYTNTVTKVQTTFFASKNQLAPVNQPGFRKPNSRL